MAKKTLDMFASAPKAPAVAETKKGKKDKEQVQLGKDLDVLCAASAVAKSLEGVQKVYDAKVKEVMTRMFTHLGVEANGRPSNFEGAGATSTASCQLKKSSSVLSTENADKLKEKGISLEEKVVREEAYLFNSAILADPVLRKKVSDALSKIDFGGVSPIIHQEKEVKMIVAEDSIDQLFKLAETEDDVKELLPMVSVLSITPKFSGTLTEAVTMLETVGVKLAGDEKEKV